MECKHPFCAARIFEKSAVLKGTIILWGGLEKILIVPNPSHLQEKDPTF